MFKKLSYKKKFNLLLIGSGIFLLIIYTVALKPTIELKKNYTDLRISMETSKDAPVKIAVLEKRLEEYSFLFNSDDNGTGNHEKIHEFVSKYCQKNNITFSDFPPMHSFKEQNYIVETNLVEAEAGFIKLIRLLHEIETSMEYGKVVSARFFSKTDLRTKTKRLYLTLCIQHIIKNNHETSHGK